MTNQHILQPFLLALLLVAGTAYANPLKKVFGGQMKQQKAVMEAAGGGGCDAALAKSLVDANDRQEKAETERDTVKVQFTKANAEVDRLVTEYATTKSTLEERIVTLETDIAAIQTDATKQLEQRQRELDEYVKVATEQTENALAKHQEDLRETQAWWKAKTDDMEKDFALKEATFKKEATETVQELETTLSSKIAQLESTIVDSQATNKQHMEELYAEAAKNISMKERELTSKHDETHAELEATKKKAEQERIQLLREQEEHANMLMTDLDLNKKTLEEQHNLVVTSLKVEMATKEKEAMEVVRAKEVELETKMESIKAEAQRQLEDHKGQHSKEMTKLMASIKAMEKDHDDLEEKMGQMERRYAAAANEIDEWQQLYSARSYCNFTHMQEDTTASIAAATKAASDSVSSVGRKATEQISVVSRQATEQITVASKVATEQLSVAGKVATERLSVASKAATKAVEPHIQKGRELYDLHVKEHVDKHVMPLHEAHVKPALQKASAQVVVASTEAQNYVDAACQRMVLEFQSTCSSLKSHVKEANLHPAMLTYVNDRCQDPQATVNSFLLGVLVIVCLIFRRFLWRSLLAILYLAFSIMWYMTPLPLFFPSNRAVAVDGDADEMEENTTPTAIAVPKIKREPSH